MKTTCSTAILFIITLSITLNISSGAISVEVTLADSNESIEWIDPNTPYVFPEMMEGTDLTLTMISDTEGKYWFGGGIYIAEPFWTIGELFGRDYNDISKSYDGSLTSNTGSNPHVKPDVATIYGDVATGFRCKADRDAIPGPWFIIDFNSYEPGECYIDIFDFYTSREGPTMSILLTFVPTRDFDTDHIVSFSDFALLSDHWQSKDIHDPNHPAAALDINKDTSIDFTDLRDFSLFWLARTRGESEVTTTTISSL